jgi:cell wall-associated NlpC family hydrolase
MKEFYSSSSEEEIMKQLRKLSVLMLLVASFFMTGCDAQQILDVIQKVATGVQQAMPAIKGVVDAFSGVASGTAAIGTNNASGTANIENTIGNLANIFTTNPNAENIAGAQNTAAAATQAAAGGTAMGARVASSIRSLVGSTRFRGADVDGGNLACAQVVSTALQSAGVLSRVSLNCDQVVSDLRAVGWQRVSVPPYQEGDVVTWTTSRGPGRHIGIIVKEGSSFKAISNSSSARTPRVHEINYMPITQVLRKV